MNTSHWLSLSVAVILFALCSFAKEPTLDVTFDKAQTVNLGGTEVVLDGGIKVLPNGGKAMSFGSKVYRFPAKELVSETGTLVLDFAVDEMKLSASPARTLMMLRSNSRLMIGISTYRNNPIVQFVFTDQTHKFNFNTGKILKPGEAHQAILSWNGDKVFCYLDGKLVKEAPQPVALNKDRLTYLNIGPHADQWYKTMPWDDDTMVQRLRAYDYALSAEEIQALNGKAAPEINLRYPRILTAPKRQGEIVIDAKLDEAAWKNAGSPVSLSALRDLGYTWRLPPHHIKFTWDEKNLYLAVDALFPQGTILRKGKGPNDPGGVYQDESFELLLTHEGNTYYFGGSVGGGKATIKNKDGSYEPKWEYASHIGVRIDDRILWQGEVVIPWQAIELQAPPKELKMNLARGWHSSTVSVSTDLANQKEKGYWADEAHNFTLRFVDSAPVLSMEQGNDIAYGEISQAFSLYSSRDTEAELSVIQENVSGLLEPQVLFSRKVQLKSNKPERLDVEGTICSEQANRLVYELKDGKTGQVVLRQDLPLLLQMEYLTVAPRFTVAKLLVNVKTSVLQKKFGADFKGSLVVSGPGGKQVSSTHLSAEQPQSLPFSKDNAPGKYKVDLQDATGKLISSVSVDFPGFGEWSKMEFDLRRIIPPYKPMVVKNEKGGLEVMPVGRSYQWRANGLMPEQIVSRGNKLFSKPASLVIGNESARLSLTSGSAKPHRVEFAANGSSSAYEIASQSWIEYDGVQYNTVKIKAKQKLGAVELRFSMPRDEAKYLHTSSCGWGNKITMELPDGDFACKYFPVVFLGNETEGLCFFAESSRTWLSKDPKPLHFTSNDMETVFTVRLADGLKAGQELEFEYGLLASPVKPLPKNYPLNTLGWYHIFPMNRPGRRPTVYCGMATWPKVLSDMFCDLPSETDNKTAFYREDVKRALAFGIKPYPYNPHYVTDEYPEVRAFMDEWQIMPQNTWSGTRDGKPHSLHLLCPASGGGDFYLMKVKHLLQKVPFHGMNFDFGIIPVCMNTLHGCHERTPLLAYRNLFRRLALLLIDSGVEDYIITVHNTDSVQLPSYTFVSHLDNGEHIRQQSSTLMHNGKDILDTYKLPMWACELSSLPFGITNPPYQAQDVLQTIYGGGKEDPELYKLRITRAMMAGPLVHNTIPRLNRCHFGVFDKLVRIYDAFNVPECEFIGYWDKSKVAEVVSGKEVYVSLYKPRSGNKVLAVISHLGNERLVQDVEIRFNPKSIGMQNFKTAFEHIDKDDPEYQQLYEIRNKYSVPLERAPLKWVPAGVKVLSFKDNVLKLHIPYHTFAIVELQ